MVVVRVWVGKESPDVRQERRIKFIRVGDTVRTAGQFKEELTLNRSPWSTFTPRVQGVGWGSCGSLDEACILGEGRLRQITSPYGVGGETGYTAQEDLKSVNSYNTGEGRILRVWFFHSCIPRPSLVLSALSIPGSPHISSFMGLPDKLLLDRKDGRPRAGPGAQKSLAAEVHMANEQMTQTINVQRAAVLHDPLHTRWLSYPILLGSQTT